MEILFTVAKAVVAFFIMLQLVLILLWVERKGSALIQDRVGANRANIFGGLLPFNLGIVNTFLADPLKGFHKEDIVPAEADKFLHWLAPLVGIVPLFLTFAVVPFGDVLVLGDYTINLQAAETGMGILLILAICSAA